MVEWQRARTKRKHEMQVVSFLLALRCAPVTYPTTVQKAQKWTAGACPLSAAVYVTLAQQTRDRDQTCAPSVSYDFRHLLLSSMILY